ncbi:hypothetical protein PQM29_003442 [Morganella morganii]|nr:hypothetical protein [Morganella morganii]
MKCRIPGIVFVMLLPLTAFAGTDVQAEKAREWVRARADEPSVADNCFRPDNPFELCLYRDKDTFGSHFADRNLQEPYQPYYFDSAPDEPENGRYRIRSGNKIGYADSVTGRVVIPAIYDCTYGFVNGTAEVGVGCEEETDGEHSWWTGGHWFRISPYGLITGFGRTPPPDSRL